jgi:hypothetical protein
VKVYLVIKHRSRADSGDHELQGVFSDQARADRYAASHGFCVIPMTLDEELPVESMGPHPDGYYPELP